MLYAIQRAGVCGLLKLADPLDFPTGSRSAPMANDRSHETALGNHRLPPETLMSATARSGAVRGLSHRRCFLPRSSCFRSAEEGRAYLTWSPGERPCRKGVPASSIRGPTIPTARSSRTGCHRRGRRNRGAVQFRHGGDRYHPADLCPAGRRDPAQPAALWRHRDTVEPDVDRVRDGRCRVL